MGRKVSIDSALSIKMAYLENVKQKRITDSVGEVIDLPIKKCGRRSLLGDLDDKVQLYLKKR